MQSERSSVMTVYLKGLDGRCDQTEKDVQTVTVDDTYIHIGYKKPYKWGIVSGVKYYTEEMVIHKIEA